MMDNVDILELLGAKIYSSALSSAFTTGLHGKRHVLIVSSSGGALILATNSADQLKTISPNPDSNDINVSTLSSIDGSQRIIIGLSTSLSN